VRIDILRAHAAYGTPSGARITGPPQFRDSR
jgi:hypothetical protein